MTTKVVVDVLLVHILISLLTLLCQITGSCGPSFADDPFTVWKIGRRLVAHAFVCATASRVLFHIAQIVFIEILIFCFLLIYPV